MGKICVFCTSPSAAGGGRSMRTGSVFRTLHQFQKQVLREDVDWNKKCHEIPENWTVCGECRPPVEAVVGATEKVRGLEESVRKLQTALLIELRRLWAEVELWRQNLGEVEDMMRRGDGEERAGSSPRMEIGLDEKVKSFRDKTFTALEKLGGHGIELTSSTLMQGSQNVEVNRLTPASARNTKNVKPRSSVSSLPAPPEVEEEEEVEVKEEPVDQEEASEQVNDLMMDNWNKDISSPPPSPSPGPVPDAGLGNEELMHPAPADEAPSPKRTPKPRQHKPKKKKPFGALSVSTDDSSDEDFNPEDRTHNKYISRPKIPNTLKRQSTFRRNLIYRLQQRNSIATSKRLPSDPQDVRRPYWIRRIDSRFYLDSVEILVLDTESSLQCSLCPYQTPALQKAAPTPEELIFDHILGKHLNAYRCPPCDLTFKDKSAYMKHRKGVHDKAYPCPVCARPCASSDCLRTHQWTHLNAEEKKDPNNAHLMPYQEKHKERFQQPRFQCSTCGKTFTAKRTLQLHSQLHLPPGEREKVMCEQCGKSLVPKSARYHKCFKSRNK